MSQILSLNGKTKSDLIEVSKGFANLGVSLDFSPGELSNETVSVYVERKGDTVDVCRDLLLIDFIALGTESINALVSMQDFQTVALVDLTVNGGNVFLGDNEKIKIQLSNLKPAKTYQLNAIESSFIDHELQQYTRKTMASETLNQDFDLRGYDLLSMQKDDTITEITLTYDNLSQVKLSQWELELMAKAIDPIVAVLSTGVQSGFENRIIYPLTGIVALNVRKTDGKLLNISLKINQEDANLYNVNR